MVYQEDASDWRQPSERCAAERVSRLSAALRRNDARFPVQGPLLPDGGVAGSSCPSQRCSLASEAISETSTMHDIPLTAHRFSSSCGTSQPSARCSFSGQSSSSAPSRRSKCSRALILISALPAWSATKTPEWTTWPACRRLYLGSHRCPHAAWAAQAARRRGRGCGEPIPACIPGFDIKLGLEFYLLFDPVGRASMRGLPLLACAVAVLAGVRDTGPLYRSCSACSCSAHLDRGRDPVLLHKQQHRIPMATPPP